MPSKLKVLVLVHA